MSDSYWEDLGSSVLQIVGEVALVSAVNQAFGGTKKQDASQIVAVQESQNAALIWVGGWCRNAGDKVLHETNPGNISEFYTIQALADHRLEFRSFYLFSDICLFAGGDGWVTDVQLVANRDGRYQDSKVRILTREGLPTETAYTETDSNVIAAFSGMLDSTFRGDGTASVMMKCILPIASYRIQAFPNGHPDLSVEGRNKAIYDWRDGTQSRSNPATWKPSANPIVNSVHLEWFRWGRDWDRCIAPVLSDLTTEANYCDGLISLNGGGSEPRYTVAFTFRADEKPDDIRAKLKASMDGFYTTDGRGHLIIRAGRYDAPTWTIPADYLEGWDWKHGVEPDAEVNRLEISFTNPAALYNSDSPEAWVISDGAKSQPFDATMVTSWTQARRLAKRKAAQLMPGYSGTINVGTYGLLWFLNGCPRYIAVSNPHEPSMDGVPLEVLDVEDDPYGQGFVFTVAKADPNIDAWNPATEEGQAPPDPQLT